MSSRFKTLVASSLIALVAVAGTARAESVNLVSSDADKFGEAIHLGVLGMSFTLESAGIVAYDPTSGLATYNAIVSNGNSGFEIVLNLMESPHAPRCFQGDCNGQWYLDNGVDPENDWIMMMVDPENENTLTGLGDMTGVVLTVLADKFFQLGQGAGGWNVTPTGLAFSGWFAVRDAITGDQLGNGDINANLAPIPVPGALLLFGSALLGLTGIRRQT